MYRTKELWTIAALLFIGIYIFGHFNSQNTTNDCRYYQSSVTIKPETDSANKPTFNLPAFGVRGPVKWEWLNKVHCNYSCVLIMSPATYMKASSK
jgi:hypothetical protein